MDQLRIGKEAEKESKANDGGSVVSVSPSGLVSTDVFSLSVQCEVTI